MARQDTWTEEQDEIIRRRARQGYSMADVAQELGKTRSAVSGRSYRIGATFNRELSARRREIRRLSNQFLDAATAFAHARSRGEGEDIQASEFDVAYARLQAHREAD